LRQRLAVAALLMALVYGIGTVGYYLLGGGRWSWGDCSYMTVISITTVGYGEVLDGLKEVPFARLFTSVLLIAGAAVALYFVSVLNTFLVEGEFLQLRRRRKMEKRLSRLEGHVIVCGIGRTGFHIAEELLASHRPFVIIDNEEKAIDLCNEAFGEKSPPFIIGDATRDEVLLAAGIDRATGLAAALREGPDNLYVVITARGLNPQLHIVAKGIAPHSLVKLEKAGADRVVSVNRIGGHRMASELIRPKVVGFLEGLARGTNKDLRFEEITVPVGSALAGKAISETDIRRERNLLIVAASGPDPGAQTYSPGPGFVIREGMTLIVLGESQSVLRLMDSSHFRSA
jgi:voltage-gated potassium channel